MSAMERTVADRTAATDPTSTSIRGALFRSSCRNASTAAPSAAAPPNAVTTAVVIFDNAVEPAVMTCMAKGVVLPMPHIPFA